LACSAPWLARSVGFVGVSDGWQQLTASQRLERTYMRAENGNVAMTGKIDLASSGGTFTMALGFGPTAMEAGQHALISLLEDFDGTHDEYIRHESKRVEVGSLPVCRSRGVSQSRTTTWAAITWCGHAISWKQRAALSRWERTSTCVLRYLQVTQEADGHWPQNM
jgi:glucoamylase